MWAWSGSRDSFLHFRLRKFRHSKSSVYIAVVNKLADGQLVDYTYDGRARRG